MRRVRSISAASAALVAVLVGGYFMARVPEPTYQGKSITAWWDEVYALESAVEDTEVGFQARWGRYTNAVHAIGPAGLPFYLACLQYEPPPEWYESADNWLQGKTSDRIRMPGTDYRVHQAYEAIQILGPAAAPCIPRLTTLLTEEAHCQVAALCLASIGLQAVPVLCEAVTNGSTLRIREAALVGLGNAGPVAESTSELLWGIVDEPFGPTGLADLGLRVVVEITTNKPALLPLLIECSARTNTAFGAAYGLARLEKAGSPYLLQGITNASKVIRCASMSALEMDFQEWALKSGASFLRFNSIYNLKCNANRMIIQNGNEARKLAAVLQKCAKNGMHESQLVEEALHRVEMTFDDTVPTPPRRIPPQ